MFADSLLDSSFTARLRRGCSTLASFGLQALALACVIAVPLLYPEALPKLQSLRRFIETPAPPALQPAAPATSSGTQATVVVPGTHPLMSPRSIPIAIAPGDPASEAPQAPIGIVGDRILSGFHSGAGIPGAIGGSYIPVMPSPLPLQHPPRVSRMMEGSLIYRVDPVYPSLAKVAGVHGQVEIAAVISRQGEISNLQVVSGHPLLVRAALDAVRQWRYRPYILNGEAVEVDTTITVNFILSGR
jgi:protein TonB